MPKKITKISDQKKEVHSKEELIKQIIAVKQFIDDHYQTIKSVDELANRTSMSKSKFTETFRGYYRKTPLQFIQAVRIFHSRQLLKSKLTIAEVSAAIGFTSVSSFSELFKTETGMTPMAFRKKKD